jgi:hypothetical protein
MAQFKRLMALVFLVPAMQAVKQLMSFWHFWEHPFQALMHESSVAHAFN